MRAPIAQTLCEETGSRIEERAAEARAGRHGAPHPKARQA